MTPIAPARCSVRPRRSSISGGKSSRIAGRIGCLVCLPSLALTACTRCHQTASAATAATKGRSITSKVYVSLNIKVRRFWHNVDVTDSDSCWNWKHSCTRGGYGKVKFNGRHTLAHRVAFELSRGPIPDDLNVLHTCDNRKCCNPNHLFLGTQADNVQDAVRKNRWPVGERHYAHRLTGVEVLEIRRLFDGGSVTKEELGHRFGVSGVMIGKIIRRERWKSI